jgi:hypothetical protein
LSADGEVGQAIAQGLHGVRVNTLSNADLYFGVFTMEAPERFRQQKYRWTGRDGNGHSAAFSTSHLFNFLAQALYLLRDPAPSSND